MSVRSLAVPVDRAGCYVPGGRARYPSTVLMTAVVAKVAGRARGRAGHARRRADGAVPDATLAAAALAGVDEVYRIGGAQAIAALAYGTESIEPVDVIVGPGNVYVAIAKREVAQEGLVGVPSVVRRAERGGGHRRRLGPGRPSPPSTSSCRPSTAPTGWRG